MKLYSRRTFDGRQAEFIRASKTHRHWQFVDTREKFKTPLPKRCRAKKPIAWPTTEEIRRLAAEHRLTNRQIASLMREIRSE